MGYSSLLIKITNINKIPGQMTWYLPEWHAKCNTWIIGEVLKKCQQKIISTMWSNVAKKVGFLTKIGKVYMYKIYIYKIVENA